MIRSGKAGEDYGGVGLRDGGTKFKKERIGIWRGNEVMVGSGLEGTTDIASEGAEGNRADELG